MKCELVAKRWWGLKGLKIRYWDLLAVYFFHLLENADLFNALTPGIWRHSSPLSLQVVIAYPAGGAVKSRPHA